MISSDTGAFYISELPPGNYELEAKLDGFVTVKRPNVIVKIAQTATLNIIMPMEGAAVEIVVEEQGNVIDTESGNQGSVLTKEFLERIPAGRSYQQAAQLTVFFGFDKTFDLSQGLLCYFFDLYPNYL